MHGTRGFPDARIRDYRESSESWGSGICGFGSSGGTLAIAISSGLLGKAAPGFLRFPWIHGSAGLAVAASRHSRIGGYRNSGVNLGMRRRRSRL